jgi:ATP-dependent Clp protease protease subunit
VDYNNPVLKSRKVLFFGEIGEKSAEVVIEKLLYLDGQGNEPIDLYLVTPGGDIAYTFAILETMRSLHSPVNTYALSECNSGGVVLLAGGTGKRRALKGAVMVVHGMEPSRGVKKAPAVFAKEWMKDFQDSYTDFWHRCAKLPESWLPLPLNSLHALSAEQALKYGIVDEVVDKSQVAMPKGQELAPATR